MKKDVYAALQRLLKTKRWEEALAHVDVLLAANPLAAQLYLLLKRCLKSLPGS